MLLTIQKKLLVFKKNATNPHYKSKYITLDNLLENLLPILNKEWIRVYHHMQDSQVITTVTNGTETYTSSFPIVDASNPQKVGSAITYAKRYNLGMIFNIVTDDDDDGNSSSFKREIQKTEFSDKSLENFKKEFHKYMKDYPTADAMLAMLDVRYIVADHYKQAIRDYYATQ